MNLGERYKELRTSVKDESGNPISIKDFAAKCVKLQAPRISELENNKREMSLTELKAYHEYFKVSFEYLMGETDVKTVDEDIQAACKVTGLSEKAIETIRDMVVTFPTEEEKEFFCKIFSSLIQDLYFKVALLDLFFLIPTAQDMVELENDISKLPEHYELSRRVITGKQEIDELLKYACSSVIKQHSDADTDELLLQRYKSMKEGVENAKHNPTP
ncbi:MAG: helix-turn-helix transcriptional regulator [Ruminococcus sp.]|nr:helix-turn-helix transcriptional regulator [Ruminococcus sp.]